MTLQKWEHQGIVDLKLNIEKSQRKLVKCRRQAAAAVHELVTPVFANLAKYLGINHVKSVAASAAGFAGDAPEGVDVKGRSSPDDITAPVEPSLLLHPSSGVAETRQDPRQVVESMEKAAAKWMQDTCTGLYGMLLIPATASTDESLHMVTMVPT